MIVCSFPSRYQHKSVTLVSLGRLPNTPLHVIPKPKGEEYEVCADDCPACDDYGFMSCGIRGRCRFGFVPYRKAWDIEKQMKAEGRCLDCGATPTRKKG